MKRNRILRGIQECPDCHESHARTKAALLHCTSRPDAATPANAGHTNETAARLSRKARAYLDAQRGYNALRTAGHADGSITLINARNIMRAAYAALTGADLGAIARHRWHGAPEVGQKGKV